jgi:hypothetical protein
MHSGDSLATGGSASGRSIVLVTNFALVTAAMPSLTPLMGDLSLWRPRLNCQMVCMRYVALGQIFLHLNLTCHHQSTHVPNSFIPVLYNLSK